MGIPLAVIGLDYQRSIQRFLSRDERNSHVHKHDVLEIVHCVTCRRRPILAEMACSKQLGKSLRAAGRRSIFLGLNFHTRGYILQKLFVGFTVLASAKGSMHDFLNSSASVLMNARARSQAAPSGVALPEGKPSAETTSADFFSSFGCSSAMASGRNSSESIAIGKSFIFLSER